MDDSSDSKPGSAGDSSVLVDVKRTLENGEDEPRNGADGKEITAEDPKTDLSSTAHPGLMRTEILDQDNPFTSKRPEIPSDTSSVKENRLLENPNKQYQIRADVDEDAEPLATQTRSRSSGSGSMEIKRPEPCTREAGSGLGDKVYILEASKASEGQGRTYIAYTIKYKASTVKRRYSDFESLRKILIKLFPMTLIPPIPEKQSITSYGKSMAGSKSSYLLPSEAAGSVDLSLSVINGSVNTNDEKLIRHRIRMLTSFLNRLLKNEEITKTSIITDFLDPNNTNWNDVITSSATISSLPKSVLLCNPLDPTNTTRAHVFLPIPSSSTQLLMNKEILATTAHDEADDGFGKVEQEYRNYEHVMEAGFYKYNKRITKNFHALRQDMKDLSEAFADFSNDQKRGAELAEQLSHLSNAFDESALELESIVGKLYYNINEPLSEAVHMAGAAQELLRYRRLKSVQKTILIRTLLYRKAQVKKLQERESEAKNVDHMVDEQVGQQDRINLKHPQNRTYSGKFMTKINKIASMVKETVSYQDPDPAVAIENLEKEIAQLSESLEVSERDLSIISTTIKDYELPKFSRERNEEVSDIMKNYTKYLKSFAERNLKLWQDVKRQQGE
ncbi:LAQU0S04e07976g1_1 [Lachancea quebecensis]|uniref:Autophagy-related protein 20 n=1 Tax=Lachancea quebecensis TaxID=1654605 RepID=A0A0P1KQH0_9SACH|nr:LAQU0S04e07976g1_1 [Lachancea quebecensis]